MSQGTEFDSTFEKWNNLKKEISRLTKEEEKIRERMKKTMISKRIATISGNKYIVRLREMSRETLSKDNCPADVWRNFAKKSKYYTLTLSSLKTIAGDEEEDS
jgi:hypothetical protein